MFALSRLSDNIRSAKFNKFKSRLIRVWSNVFISDVNKMWSRVLLEFIKINSDRRSFK